MDAALRPFTDSGRYSSSCCHWVVVTTILSVFISSIVTRPVRALVKGARSIQQGDYTQTLPVLRQDEIGTCTVAFNLMQEAIAERESRSSARPTTTTLTGLPNRSYLQLSMRDKISMAREKHQSLR